MKCGIFVSQRFEMQKKTQSKTKAPHGKKQHSSRNQLIVTHANLRLNFIDFHLQLEISRIAERRRYRND